MSAIGPSNVRAFAVSHLSASDFKSAGLRDVRLIEISALLRRRMVSRRRT
jgi:hypothetical protein